QLRTYNQDCADLAWERGVAFLKANVH
ncbi:MAG: hypothetical protein QOH14_3896, partial [Pseudonocardiales bacterium]|nr:hypothetical protein [Pseudonocardiales bacterium]